VIHLQRARSSTRAKSDPRDSHYSLLEITHGSFGGKNIIQGPQVEGKPQMSSLNGGFYKTGTADFHFVSIQSCAFNLINSS